MSKAKFQAAQELITQHKYDEARTILKTVEHPKAREWEARLDKIAPKKNKKGTYIKIALIIAGILFIVLALTLDNKRASDNMAAFKQQQASDQQVSDMQACLLQYPNSTRLYNACMISKGH